MLTPVLWKKWDNTGCLLYPVSMQITAWRKADCKMR
jgi:hypothetical protein